MTTPPAEDTVRIAFRATLDNLVPEEVNALREALGDDFDAGAFWLGMQMGALAMVRVDGLDTAQRWPHLFTEMLEAVRVKAPQTGARQSETGSAICSLLNWERQSGDSYTIQYMPEEGDHRFEVIHVDGDEVARATVRADGSVSLQEGSR